MSVITLTTDFGSGDHEAGVLKGVIWSIAPEVKIADLSHEIPRHDVMEAAILMGRVAPYFPAGTIQPAVLAGPNLQDCNSVSAPSSKNRRLPADL